jgi:hypothetical protein
MVSMALSAGADFRPRGRGFFSQPAGKNLGFHYGGIILITASMALVNHFDILARTFS